MCYRYVVPKEERHDQLFMSINNLPLLNEEEHDVYPGNSAPVILCNRREEPSVFLMRWGYKPAKELIYNTRSETVSEKILFKTDFIRHRCLVPAVCYYESDKEKVHYRFKTGDNIMYLAGIYHIENDAMMFSILTKKSSEEISGIHDRMPVILAGDDAKNWINPKMNPNDILCNSIDTVVFEKERIQK